MDTQGKGKDKPVWNIVATRAGGKPAGKMAKAWHGTVYGDADSKTGAPVHPRGPGAINENKRVRVCAQSPDGASYVVRWSTDDDDLMYAIVPADRVQIADPGDVIVSTPKGKRDATLTPTERAVVTAKDALGPSTFGVAARAAGYTSKEKDADGKETIAVSITQKDATTDQWAKMFPNFTLPGYIAFLRAIHANQQTLLDGGDETILAARFARFNGDVLWYSSVGRKLGLIEEAE